MRRIAVIGLGYVGLPLALLADRKGYEVTGIDVDKSRVKSLEDKTLQTDDARINAQLKKTSIEFTSDFKPVNKAEAAIICVPTPVDDNRLPDITILKSAVENTARNIKPGALIVVESTINPGICNEIVIPLVEETSGLKVGQDIFVAHCPERINPGDEKWSVDNINRVLGADSEKGLGIAYDLYSNLIDAKVKKMSNLQEAEAVKIVENTFRDVNIAFVNELAMSFNKFGIDINKVIEGAATKPFAFMAHYPGIGVGGHCIPVDPYYLIEHARNNGFDHKFLSLARSINESMPVYSVDLLEQALIEKAKKTLSGANVIVLGVSYKANVGDDRESPAYTVIETLKQRGANVSIYDPHIPEHSTCKNTAEALSGKDAAVLVTGHDEFCNLDENIENLSVFLDGRNFLKSSADRIRSKGAHYIGIGSS